MRLFLIAFPASLLMLFAACSQRGFSGIAVPSAFQSLVPPDTRALAGADVDALKNSAFCQHHQNALNFPLLDEMSERIGLDPRRDLSYVLIAWNGKQPIALARGRFNPKDLEPKLVSLGFRRAQYKGHALFGDSRDALTFEPHGLAIAGPGAAVRSEIDLENGSVPRELEDRLRRIPRGDQLWAVSRGGLAFADFAMRSDIESALSNIASFISASSFGIGVDAGAHLEAEIDCVSDEGAQRVRDALRGGIGLARLTTKDDESDLLQAYDAVQVSQDKQTVRVKADLPANLTDKLLAHLPALRRRAGEVLQQQ